MQVFLAFQVHTVFDELEPCHLDNLQALKKWLKFFGFLFDVQVNQHLQKAIQVREITIYCPKETESTMIQDLYHKLLTLKEPYTPLTEGEEMPDLEPESPGHREVKIAENQVELSARYKSVLGAQTNLEFYDTGRETEAERPASEVYGAKTSGGAIDPERSTKRPARKARG